LKKLLVVGVIVLFLGLAIAPSINADVDRLYLKPVTNSVFEETEEITISRYKADGTIEKTTVKLSKERALEFADRLKRTDDSDERFTLYKEYGLIPEDVTRESLRQEMLQLAERVGITEEKINSISERFIHNGNEPRLFGINFLNEIIGISGISLNLPIGLSLIIGFSNWFFNVRDWFLLPSVDLFYFAIFIVGLFQFTNGLLPDFQTFGIGSFLLLGFVGLVASIPFVSVIPVIIGFSVASLVIGQIWDVNVSG